MKKLVCYFILILFVSSCSCPDEPGSPYGAPDDKDTYESGDYKTITYTYYCYNGNYRSVTYTQTESCGKWERSEYTSSCIKK